MCLLLQDDSKAVLFVFQDIEDFETKTRSTVSVREGQGVVLLCGPPPHFGGMVGGTLGHTINVVS